MLIVLDLLGWAGALTFLVAYYLVSCGKLQTDARLYQIMNLGGAIAVGLSVLPKKAWPAFFLELVWGSIALISLIRICNRTGSKY